MAKVFWGVLLALLVFSGISVVLFAIGVLSFASAAHEIVLEDTRRLQQDQRARGQERVRRMAMQRAAAVAELARRTLGPDQSCVGGVIIQRSGTSYTQLGTISDPVHCAGRRADRPLR